MARTMTRAPVIAMAAATANAAMSVMIAVMMSGGDSDGGNGEYDRDTIGTPLMPPPFDADDALTTWVKQIPIGLTSDCTRLS